MCEHENLESLPVGATIDSTGEKGKKEYIVVMQVKCEDCSEEIELSGVLEAN